MPVTVMGLFFEDLLVNFVLLPFFACDEITCMTSSV